MINKTFNSHSTDGRALEVGRNGERPWLNIREFDLENTMFMLAPSDAPALALAVLEAAGVTETDSPYMQEAADNLRAYILIEEKVTAEARELAELEAEAEALYRVYFETAEMDYKNWEKLEQRVKDYWLAVARRAREMRAEK